MVHGAHSHRCFVFCVFLFFCFFVPSLFCFRAFDFAHHRTYAAPGIRPPHIPAFMPPLPPSTSRETSAGSGRSLAEVRIRAVHDGRWRHHDSSVLRLGPAWTKIVDKPSY